MSITASAIFTAVRAHLDDDNSGRYTEAADLVPALNDAIEYLVVLFNAAFEQKKMAPESLRELVRTQIVDVIGSGTKKADVTSLMSSLWTIFGVDPDPEITTGPDTLAVTRNRWATRISLEAWNDTALDPFSPGTSQTIPSDFLRAAYIGPAKYFSDSTFHILIRPGSIFTANKAAVWYLKNPTRATSGSSTIEFPQSLFVLLVNKTLNYMSRQHGPEGKYNQVTDQEIVRLINLMNG